MSDAKDKVTAVDVTKFVHVHRGKKHKVFRCEAQGNFYTRKEIGGKAPWKCLDSPIARIAIGVQKSVIHVTAVDGDNRTFRPVEGACHADLVGLALGDDSKS